MPAARSSACGTPRAGGPEPHLPATTGHGSPTRRASVAQRHRVVVDSGLAGKARRATGDARRRGRDATRGSTRCGIIAGHAMGEVRACHHDPSCRSVRRGVVLALGFATAIGRGVAARVRRGGDVREPSQLAKGGE